MSYDVFDEEGWAPAKPDRDEEMDREPWETCGCPACWATRDALYEPYEED